MVFIFGLLHGLGFASVLAEFGLPVQQFIPALIGFNIGWNWVSLVLFLSIHWDCYWFNKKIGTENYNLTNIRYSRLDRILLVF